MLHDIHVSSQDPKNKETEHLVHDAEKCSFLREFQSQVRHVLWTRFRRNIYFLKGIGTTLDEHCWTFLQKVTDFHTVDKRILFCEDVQAPQSVGWSSSVQPTTSVRSTEFVLILDNNKTMLKVVTIQHWIVVTSRVSGPASSSRVSVTDNFSYYAWLAEENLSARASMLEGNMSTGRDRMAKGNLLQIHQKKSIDRISSREGKHCERKNSFDCVMLHVIQNS